MSMTVVADSLLSYTIEPDPNPLTVSTAKDPVVGRLDITVGLGNSGPAYCKSVTVRIPIGAGASALTENRAQLTSAVVGASGWTPRPGFADGTWQVFEFVPERPVQVTGRAVTLVVSQIEVNTTVGEADIEIIEETSPTNGSFTPKPTEASVTKFPAEFVFRNFRPTKIMVCNGEHAVLKWDGSADAAYTMFWDRNSQDVSNVREWTTPQPLTAPTGFMLQATVTAAWPDTDPHADHRRDGRAARPGSRPPRHLRAHHLPRRSTGGADPGQGVTSRVEAEQRPHRQLPFHGPGDRRRQALGSDPRWTNSFSGGTPRGH